MNRKDAASTDRGLVARVLAVSWRIAVIVLALVGLISAFVVLKAALTGNFYSLTKIGELIVGKAAIEGLSALLTLIVTAAVFWHAAGLAASFSSDMERNFDLRTLPRLMSGVAVLTLLLIFGAACTSNGGLFGQEAAAWAQAGGSVEALLIAVYVGRLSIDAEERRRRRSAADLINAINDSADLALNAVDAMRVAIRAPDLPAFLKALKEYEVNATFPLGQILKMPLERWPSPIFYTRALALHSTLSVMVQNAGSVGPMMQQGSIGEWNSLQTIEKQVCETEVAYKQSREGLKLD